MGSTGQYRTHRQQLRQSETQRATLTNYLLAITAGLSAFTIAQDFSLGSLAAAGVIIGIGLFGALASAKYHERATHHLTQARALTTTLRELRALPDNPTLDQHRNTHYRYRTLHKIRLHWLWTGLHLAITIYGLTLAAIIIARHTT